MRKPRSLRVFVFDFKGFLWYFMVAKKESKFENICDSSTYSRERVDE